MKRGFLIALALVWVGLVELRLFISARDVMTLADGLTLVATALHDAVTPCPRDGVPL